MANTNAIWQQAAHTTYQLSSSQGSTRTTLNVRGKLDEHDQENGFKITAEIRFCT